MSNAIKELSVIFINFYAENMSVIFSIDFVMLSTAQSITLRSFVQDR